MWLSRNKEHKDTQDQGAAELQAIRQSMAMIEFTPDGIILDANPAFLGVVNYRLEEIVGKLFTQVASLHSREIGRGGP